MTTWQIFDATSGRVLGTTEAPNHAAAVRQGQAAHGGAIGARYESPELRELADVRAKVRAVLQHCATVASAEPKPDDLGARERVLARWVIATLGSVATAGGGAS